AIVRTYLPEGRPWVYRPIRWVAGPIQWRRHRSSPRTERFVQPIEHPLVGEGAGQRLAVVVRAFGRSEPAAVHRPRNHFGQTPGLARPELFVRGVGDERRGGGPAGLG